MKANQLFEHLLAKNDLSPEQAQHVIEECISGQLNDVQIASFLVLMRMKGETANELSAIAKVMHKMAHSINLGTNLIDIVGTGGDGKNTFNVSTACSFVVAGAGVKVAKHGNRSVSSRSGSADLLEQANFVLNLSEDALKTCIEQCGIAFLFAPHYHPAMQKVRSARQQLGIRTLFNLIGPLMNPAKVKRQVVGVFSSDWLETLSSVLTNLGSERHLVVSSMDNLDEISIAADTKVLEYKQGKISNWIIHPEDYELKHKNLDDIIVQSPAESLAIIKEILAGSNGPARDIVVLNAAAAIYCANDQLDFAQAIESAKNSIDSGKAANCFSQLCLLTQKLNKDQQHE